MDEWEEDFAAFVTLKLPSRRAHLPSFGVFSRAGEFVGRK